jgi:D-glycero-D-manno-heptose 1,7-bisphosphate phosphatase
VTTLFLFDLDGTLISSYMDRADKDYHAWELLRGRAERVAELRRENFVGIVTNQGGVAFGLTSEADFRRKIALVADALGYGHVELWAGGEPESFGAGKGLGQLGVWACYADSRARDPRYRDGAERRKPSGAMIREAAEMWPNTAIIYVGDRPEDQAAAADAGVAFSWAEEFFR